MRFELSHFLTLAVVAIAGWWIGRNISMPGDEMD